MQTRHRAILLAVGFGCAGCGGGAGVSSAPVPGRYQGTYAGEFIDKQGLTGQLTLQVSGTNPEAVSGQFVYPAQTWSFTGQITSGGTGTVDYQSDAAGTLQFGPAGQPTTKLSILTNLIILPAPTGSTGSTGTTGSTGGDGSGTGTVFPNAQVALISNPTGVFGGANSFAGSYAGTIQDTTLDKPDILAITIQSSGAVTGTGSSYVNGSPVLTSVSGTLSSSGSLSLVLANQVSVSGTVSLAKGTISGPLKLSNGDGATLSISQVQP